MSRISSHATFLYKRVFPIFWFGLLLLFLAFGLIGALRSERSPSLLFLIVPLLMMAFGYFIMKKMIFDLVDEVVDVGDALMISNGGRQERVALSDIVNVSYASFVNPPRVTLLLRTPGAFGSRVTFCAPIRLVPFSTSPVIDALIERIDAARRR
jgi:hypothetical protein